MASIYSASLPHVNSTAESFVSAYYGAWDNDRTTLKTLYTPTSRIVWNGNPISGGDEMALFIDKMPASKHDIQAFDCHPLPGAAEPAVTAIMITVSGTLLLYDAAEGMPAQPAPRGPPGQPRQRRDNRHQNDDPDTLPRLFSHTFTIVPIQGPQGQLLHSISGETFRYVG